MNIVKRVLISLRYRINRWLDGPDQMERLEMNGLRYGKNFHLYNSFIDEGHAFLVEIGDDVTITNSTILAHDASTKLDLNYSRVGGGDNRKQGLYWIWNHRPSKCKNRK